MRKSCAATLRRGLLSISLPGANQRVHGRICRAAASVRFDFVPKVRQSLRKFVRCLHAFPKGVGTIVEQLMKTRVCELRASRRVFCVAGKLVGCARDRRDPNWQCTALPDLLERSRCKQEEVITRLTLGFRPVNSCDNLCVLHA